MPEATGVSVVPLTVHTLPVPDAKETARPELAVATRLVFVPTVWVPGDVKLMLCVASCTVKVWLVPAAAA